MDGPFLRRVSWRHAALGALLALLVSLLAAYALAASVAGVAAGGFLAARLAGAAGVLQGAAVAMLWILAATVLSVPTLPADTLGVMGFDLVHLVAGALGGWLALRS